MSALSDHYDDEGNLSVLVNGYDAPEILDTMVRLYGTVADTDIEVVFAADHRPAMAIIEALEADDSPVACVPSWAVLSHDSWAARGLGEPS